MTYRELIEIYYPEAVDDEAKGGVRSCPSRFFQGASNDCNSRCYDCWNRRVEDDATVEIYKNLGKLRRSNNIKPNVSQKGNDPVNKPSHYTDGKIEVIDFIEDKNLGFHLGNVVKYVSRAGKKDPSKTVEDLKKASWYLNRYIKMVDKHEED